MVIQAADLSYRQVNQQIRGSADACVEVRGCCGHRFVADGSSGKTVDIYGTPGNALGAYLNGSTVRVHGNAQDAVGDTMNEGLIAIDGMAGDATGYAMRGGRIFVHGDIGYRAGIHMKAYQQKQPLLVVGGKAGSFLGEYQAGGTIVVLGLGSEQEASAPVGNFCGVGMHGGKIFMRTRMLPVDLSDRLIARPAEERDLDEIRPALEEFCALFAENMDDILSESFYVITPNSRNPYKQLYTVY